MLEISARISDECAVSCVMLYTVFTPATNHNTWDTNMHTHALTTTVVRVKKYNAKIESAKQQLVMAVTDP